MFQGATARFTRFATASIDPELLLKIARRAILLLEVAQRRTAALDRISQDFDDMSVQLFDSRFADTLGSSCWMDAREK
jgi:hypothetical protein